MYVARFLVCTTFMHVAFPGWDFTFSGGCDGGDSPAGVVSQSFQRPMGVGLQANTTVMQARVEWAREGVGTRA